MRVLSERRLAVELGALASTPRVVAGGNYATPWRALPVRDGPVTSFQHSFIVSDQGTAVIWGHDASGQAEQIISQVAHPSVREGLRLAGRDLGLRV